MAHSSPSRKKRPTDGQSTQPSKKQKKSAGGDAKKGKGKDSDFQVVSATLSISVPPVFAKNPQAGVEEMLDSLIMRYVPSLEGVVIAHSNLTFTTPTARIKDDCPFLVCNIRFDATVWNPKIGSKMKGRIILSSPDHISLLVHRTFNVSIPRHHIPSDEWEFEYGPAENDPEFGADAADEEGQAEGETEGVKEGEEQPVKTEEASTGKWVHRTTGERLGGTDKKVEFTVIGLTVANEMLSLVGSIQDDPFSPAHKPYQSTNTATKTKTSGEEDDADEPPDDDEDDESGSEEEDTMRLLKRKAAAAAKETSKSDTSKPSKKKKRKTDAS